MPKLIINNEARLAVCGAADNFGCCFFTDTSRKLPNGLFEVQVEESTLERLNEIRFSTESMSDVIIRLVSVWKTNGRFQ